MTYSPEQIALYQAGGCGNATIVMRVGTPEPEYLWMGDGNYQADPSDPIAPSAVFQGCGILRDMPPLQAMRNGQADLIDFTLAGGRGIPQAWIIDPESAGVIDARVNLGVIGLDRDLQPIGQIAWFWPGRVSHLGTSDGEEGQYVTLSVFNGKALRARPELRRWSNASHQSRHTGDRACERTDLYRRISNVVWPQ